MFSLGFGEILFLAFIALVFIGPEQLPEVAKAVARLINEWKRASSDLTGTITKNIQEDVVNQIMDRREGTKAEMAKSEPPPQEPLQAEASSPKEEIELPRSQVQQLEFNFEEKPKNES